MKKIWTLTIRTSLPDVAQSKEDIQTVFESSFEEFEKAKETLRQELKKLAFSENAMFDGKGGMIYLKNYAKDLDNEFDMEDEVLSLRKFEQIQEALLGIFKGEDKPLELKPVKDCTDWMIAVDIKKDSIRIYGAHEGPINGYEPTIKTNMFDMTKPQKYYLYLDDLLGQDYSSELYIDLVKTPLEE